MNCFFSLVRCCFPSCCNGCGCSCCCCPSSAKVAPHAIVPEPPTAPVETAQRRSLPSLVVSSPSGNDIQLGSVPRRRDEQKVHPEIKELCDISDSNFIALDHWKEAASLEGRVDVWKQFNSLNLRMTDGLEELLDRYKAARDQARERQKEVSFDPVQLRADQKILRTSFLGHEVRSPLINIAELLKDVLRRGPEEDISLRDLDQPKTKVRLRELLEEEASVFFAHLQLNFKLVRERLLDLGGCLSGTPPAPTVPESFTLPELMERVEAQTLYYAKLHKVGLKFPRPSEIPALPLGGHKKKVAQVFLNLITNAVKFSPPGEVVHIVVKIAQETLSSFVLDCSVIDVGPGILEEDQPNLFQPFFQARIKAQTTVKTSGLGLAICKELAEALGGSIGCESRLGRGSRFWFLVPVTKMPLSTETPPSPRPPLTLTLYNKDVRILFAEDVRVIQKTVLMMMRRAGAAQCVVADDGRMAVDQFLLYGCDVALLDMQMPHLYGWEVVKKICELVEERGLVKLPRFIICSAHEPDQVQDILTQQNITVPVVILKKPLEYAALINALNRANDMS